MDDLEIEKTAKEIANQTVYGVLHSENKALEDKVYLYAQKSINVLLINYTNKILDYEAKIKLVHEDMERIYKDIIEHHEEMIPYYLVRKGHRFIHALNVCYILGAISFEEMKNKMNEVNNLIPNDLDNRL